MNKHWMLLSFLFSSVSFADQYLCSTNMVYVYTGDTQESVIAACGQPTEVINQTPPNPNSAAAGSESSIGWYYPAAISNRGTAGTSVNPSLIVGNRQITLMTNTPAPVNLGISFVNGVVASIQRPATAGALGLGANTAQEADIYTCSNGPIKVGSTMSEVTSACGLPAFQKNLGPATPQQQGAGVSVATTWLIYKPQSYLPPQTFIFQNGVLVGQK